MATTKTTRKAASPRKSTPKAKSTTAKTAARKDKDVADAAKAPKVTTARKTVKIAPKASAAVTKAPVEDSTPAPEARAVAPRPAHMRKRELINTIAERSGVKRRDAKAALEAALSIMGEAIAEGRGLNLPGLGKMKVVRTKKLANAHVYVTRIRQADQAVTPEPEPGDKDPLAEAAE